MQKQLLQVPALTFFSYGFHPAHRLMHFLDTHKMVLAIPPKVAAGFQSIFEGRTTFWDGRQIELFHLHKQLRKKMLSSPSLVHDFVNCGTEPRRMFWILGDERHNNMIANICRELCDPDEVKVHVPDKRDILYGVDMLETTQGRRYSIKPIRNEVVIGLN